MGIKRIYLRILYLNSTDPNYINRWTEAIKTF